MGYTQILPADGFSSLWREVRNWLLYRSVPELLNIFINSKDESMEKTFNKFENDIELGGIVNT